MTYEEALQKINSRLRFGIKPGLERIEALCKKLGDPQKKPRFVHVAGTNGKGTTCTLIASVLTAAGYRTGLYTSPYVLDFRERFRIDGEMIPEAELIEEVKRVSPVADELEAAGDTVTVRESGYHQKGRRRRAVPRAGSVRVRDHRIGVQRARRTPAYSG